MGGGSNLFPPQFVNVVIIDNVILRRKMRSVLNPTRASRSAASTNAVALLLLPKGVLWRQWSLQFFRTRWQSLQYSQRVGRQQPSLPRATTIRQASHVENSTIQIDHVKGYTDLEWPIDARNRRNVLCACFSHAQTRPEITPYPKSAHNGTSNSARNSGCATDRSPIIIEISLCLRI